MTKFALTDLTVRRGTHPVVAGVNFDLKPGEMTGLIGPNGAGKTTLMRAALGLLPCAGTSTADGQKDAFVLLPTGTCERLVGGSTEKG